MHLVAIDTETCALGPGRDRIVQFCAIELDGELRETSRWTELVNPGRPIPAQATAIHRITDGMVASRPPFAAFAPKLRGLFKPDTVFIGYNAGFDLGVLNSEFARCGIPVIPVEQPVIDPLQIERKVLSRSLGPTYERYFGKPLDDAHRADADIAATVEVLRAQRRVHADKLPQELEDLVAWPQADPRRRRRRRSHIYKDDDGVLRFGFGRHMDRPVLEQPEYLAWMLGQDFPEASKRRVRQALEQTGLQVVTHPGKTLPMGLLPAPATDVAIAAARPFAPASSLTPTP